MKKILITILIFLLTAMANSYAAFFENRVENSDYSYIGTTGQEYSDNQGEPEESIGGFFKSPGDNPLINRPGTGGGIGQGTDPAPIGKGLHTLLVCSLIYGIVKVSSKKNRNNRD